MRSQSYATPPPHVRKRRDARDSRLRSFGFDSYPDYIASAAWAATKARYRDSDLPQQCMCGEGEGLHLHHKTYERVAEEALTDLVPLCPPCHRLVHILEWTNEMGLDFDGLVNSERAARYRADPHLAAMLEVERAKREERERRALKAKRRAAQVQKVVPEDVERIRALYAEGWTLADLAAEFGVRQSNIARRVADL